MSSKIGTVFRSTSIGRVAMPGNVRRALPGLSRSTVLSGLAALIAISSARAQDLACSTTPSLSPPSTIPDDVCDSSDERGFDQLAWEAFKYLVWPAREGRQHRGETDTSRPITDLMGPRTFETLKTDWETFKPDAARPTDWDDPYPTKAEPCLNTPAIRPGEPVLASYSEFGNVKEFVDPHVTNSLVAQNSTYVRYQAAYGKLVYQTILQNQLYDALHYNSVVAGSNGSPVAATTEPYRSLTLKSSWIELPGVDCERRAVTPSRFYVTCAWLQDPEKLTCRKSAVGLVGLHIVLKTRSRPQWIWATFEHVDNVPQGDPTDAYGTSYTFNNGDAELRMTHSAAPTYQIPRPLGVPGPGTPPKPYQVERLQNITDRAQEANIAWRAELKNAGSIWQNYKLVMVQWPLTAYAPDMDGEAAGPNPNCSWRQSKATVNTTMETFLQTSSSCTDQAKMRTCMTCHNKARSADFVWSIVMNPNHPPRFPLFSLPRAQALDTLRSIVQDDK